MHHQPPTSHSTLSSWSTDLDQRDVGSDLAEELGLDEPTRAAPSNVRATTAAFVPLCDVHLRRPEARRPPPSDVARPPPTIVHEPPSDPVLSLWLTDDPTPDACGSVDETRAPEIHARPAVRGCIVALIRQLGVLSRRRPVLVAVAALCSSAILALAILALNRCATDRDEGTDRAGVRSPHAELSNDVRTAGSAQ